MNLENLHINEYIVVITHRKTEQVQTGGSIWGNDASYEEKELLDGPLVTGEPLRVVGLCYPFIMVSDGKRRFPLDCREISVTKAPEEYVKAWNPQKEKPNVQVLEKVRQESLPTIWTPIQTSPWDFDTTTTGTSCKKEIPEPEPPKEPELKKCPCCGDTMVENLKEGERKWSLECKTCGFRGEKK